MKKIVLTLACMIFAFFSYGQHHWSPEGSYEDNQSITGVIVIDGIIQDNPNLEIGAFCGDESRAFSNSGTFFPPLGHYVVELTIKGNNGDIITFKVFDKVAGVEKDLICETSHTLQINNDINAMQGFQFVFTTPITGYNLDIIGYDGQSGNGYNWYLISSPIGEVDPLNVLGMIDPEDPDNNDGFDLFRFNQSADDEWENWKQVGDHHHFNLEPCKGYLYASGVDTRLTFVGDAYSGSGEVTLVKDDNANLAGWNLIGNPFGETASIGRDFYVMNPAGSEIVLAETNQIEAMQGVFVIAEHDGETVTFTPGASANDGNKLVINVAQNRSSVIDRAIVRFGQGNQLPKFMLNPNNTKIYIPQAGNDYAVVRSNNEEELPLNFKAAANGTYILKVDANTTEMDYLHLVDNKTGNDIDLLENPSYTFEASATDFANRFKLVLRNTTSIDENTNFAFYNGLDWTVNNEGKSTLQVVDMTGRIVSTETIDGTAHVTINAAPGAYMLQLTNGNDVKTQKVVIK